MRLVSIGDNHRNNHRGFVFPLSWGSFVNLRYSDEDSEEILCQGPDMIWLDLILLLDPISSEEFPISRKIIQTVIQEKTKEALDLLYKSAYLWLRAGNRPSND